MIRTIHQITYKRGELGMRLKKMTVSLLAAAMAVTTLAGCGAMPSTGNANGNGASENTGVASKEEEKTDDR